MKFKKLCNYFSEIKFLCSLNSNFLPKFEFVGHERFLFIYSFFFGKNSTIKFSYTWLFKHYLFLHNPMLLKNCISFLILYQYLEPIEMSRNVIKLIMKYLINMIVHISLQRWKNMSADRKDWHFSTTGSGRTTSTYGGNGHQKLRHIFICKLA